MEHGKPFVGADGRIYVITWVPNPGATISVEVEYEEATVAEKKAAEAIRWNEWTVKEMVEMLVHAMNENFSRTFFIHGPPAVGKSSGVKQAARKAKRPRHLIDDRLSQKDPTDLRGVLCPAADGKDLLAQYLISPEYRPLFEGDAPACLLLDEHNHASELMQKASYEVALDHAIGGRPFKPGTVVILAGNREIDNANITPMDRPMQSRVVHVYVRFDAAAALEHMINDGGFHPLVLSYLRERPDKIYAPMPDASDYYGEPLPRTWEEASDTLRCFDTSFSTIDKLIAGCVGVGEAQVFMAYVRSVATINPLIDAIENGADKTAPDLALQFFVCQSLVERFRMSKSHKARHAALATRILDYAVSIKRKAAEIGSLMIDAAYSADHEALSSQGAAYDRAVKEYARMLT